MPRDEFGSTGTLKDGVFVPFTEKDVKGTAQPAAAPEPEPVQDDAPAAKPASKTAARK